MAEAVDPARPHLHGRRRTTSATTSVPPPASPRARSARQHEELLVEPDPVELVSQLTSFLDEPLGDEAILPTFLISQVARRHVTVALTGDGGDESFAGYERYVAMRMAERVERDSSRAEPRRTRAPHAPRGAASSALACRFEPLVCWRLRRGRRASATAG